MFFAAKIMDSSTFPSEEQTQRMLSEIRYTPLFLPLESESSPQHGAYVRVLRVPRATT